MARRIGMGVVCMVILALAGTVPAFAQEPIDIVYLKDGRIVSGTVVELTPNETITIETSDGVIAVLEMSNVEKITRRPVAGQKTQSNSLDAAATQPTAAHYLVVNGPGVLQFGPTVEYGFRLTPRLYGLARVRFPGLGAFSRLLSSFNYSGEIAFWSTAVSTGIRYFFLERFSPNPYFGATGGIGYTPYHSAGNEYSGAWHGNCFYLTAGANIGLRWQSNNFLIDIGGFVAFTPTIYDKWSFDGAPTVTYDGNVNFRFVAMLEASLGWVF